MTPTEAHARIDEISGQFSDHAADAAKGKVFVEAIKNACDIYLSLADPAGIAGEIKDLLPAIRRRPMDASRLLAGLSPGARELIDLHDEFSCSDGSLTPAMEAISVLITAGQVELKKGKPHERRSLIGQINPGRPKKSRESVLVSLIAAAYAKATGRPTARSWSGGADASDDMSVFERIVEDVLVALLIDDRHSAIHLVRRHVEDRDRLSTDKG